MHILNRAFTGLFAITLSVFLLLAFALVIVQFGGLISAQPAWIDWGAEHITRPSIIAAVLTGLFGFAAFNVRPKQPRQPDDEDEEE